jgi:hypothetical protein
MGNTYRHSEKQGSKGMDGCPLTESGTDQPKDNDLKGWLQAARRVNLNHLANEAFHYTLRCPAATLTTYPVPSDPPFSFLHPNAMTPMIPAAMPALLCTLPSGPPTNINQTRTSNMTPELCYQCHQSRHISQDCPLHYDVHHMTIDEKDNMIEKIMADNDTTIVITAASTHLEEEMIIECEVSDEDFIWSSR